jgi:hypothetical protein
LGKAFLSNISKLVRIPPEFTKLLLQNRDAFDALVACLITRAVAVDLCIPIPLDCLEIAKSEGWIALPMKGSLASLAASA